MTKDIRISASLFSHTKIIKLRRRLGAEGVLSLIQLWTYASQNRCKGELYEMTQEDIAIAAGWPGEEKQFIETLVDLKLLDFDSYYIIHDWTDHNTFAAFSEVRSEAGRKAASARWKKNEKCDPHSKSCDPHSKSMRPHENTDAPVPSPVPSPVPYPVPSPVPKPEKEGSSKSMNVLRKDEKKERPPKQKTTIPPEFGLTPAIEAWAQEQNYHDLDLHLASFKDKAQANGYQYADWNAAFRNAVRDDWAKLRQKTNNPTPRNGTPSSQLSRQGQQQVSSIEVWLQQPTTIEAEIISSEFN